MFTVVFLVKKKPSMTPEEFTRYWIDEHTPFTSKVPGVRSYRCYPMTGYPDAQPPFDAVATLGFDDEAAWKRAAASPELAAAIGDAPNFQDTGATMAFFAEERVIV
ncbi:MAG: hypothetical protein QOF33_2741 [Thermomicrobiales bacterium]|nr:hypothetical protein [Thermomicrobiales bacterium]MEA2523566.1 hypothetical protein [Thermomicrobiales bacterium]MEA2584656.1 hypothetical protein [Thermomicrobiales bacterium]MEA2595776.1 hypothetical protein [Thermomicrobiales bacterium]